MGLRKSIYDDGPPTNLCLKCLTEMALPQHYLCFACQADIAKEVKLDNHYQTNLPGAPLRDCKADPDDPVVIVNDDYIKTLESANIKQKLLIIGTNSRDKPLYGLFSPPDADWEVIAEPLAITTKEDAE